MTITMRPFTGETDFAALVELVKMIPASTPHVVDLPWRMSSPVTTSGRDAYIWQDEDGSFLGFAAWQQAWAALDYYVRPGSYKQEIEDQLFSVVEQRFHELDQEHGEQFPYWVEFRDDDTERKAVAEQHGYTLQVDYSCVQMQHPLTELLMLLANLLSPHYDIRPLFSEQVRALQSEKHESEHEVLPLTTLPYEPD